MRPLDRPPCSSSFSDYKSYRDHLLTAYGRYCAYCEKKDGDLDIEHVEPKSKVPSKITEWTNLLLACPTCNRDYKKNKNGSRAGYIFPDTDDSFNAFLYKENGLIEGPSAEARATIALCGLDREAAIDGRADAFERARTCKREILAGTRTVMNVLPWAQSLGHWSVWMTVFFDVPEMVVLLRDPAHFPGTR